MQRGSERTETVARPLREEGDGDDDPQSSQVALSLEERDPRRLVLLLGLDRLSDLRHLIDREAREKSAKVKERRV